MTQTSPKLRALFSVVTALGLLGWLATSLHYEALRQLLIGVDLRWLAVAALLGPLQVLGAAMRWSVTSECLGQPLPIRRALPEFALGYLLNHLLPGGIAGDAVRVWRQGRTVRVAPALRAAIVDRWVGLLVHSIVVVVGLVVWRRVHPVGPPAGALGLALCWAVGIASVPLLPVQIGREARQCLSVRGPLLVGLSGLLSASFLGGFWLCSLAIGEPLGMATLTVIPLILLAMVVPMSIGGWGLREATAVALLSRVGWSPEAAFALSAAYGVSSLGGALPGVFLPLFTEEAQ